VAFKAIKGASKADSLHFRTKQQAEEARGLGAY
jgi:hypothetical protein